MSITITANIGPTTAHLPVSSDPSSDILQIESEQIRVRQHGVETLLVDRGWNGTARVAHSSGAIVTPIIGGDQVAPLDCSALVPGTETSGSILTSKSSWIDFSTPGACGGKLLLQNSSATGEFATWRMRARANAATGSGDGGNSVGTTTCIDASASANHDDYGVLRAVNACAQPNAFNQTTDATNIVTALYGRIDRTGTSVGRSWVAWLDTHMTTKAAAGDYMERISHNGTVANDGVWTIYNGGRMPVLFNFEDVAGLLSAVGGTLTATHKIAINIAGVGVRYIVAGTVA